MTRGLTWPDVRSVLDEFGTFRYEVGPLGFTVRAPVLRGYRDHHEDWRIRCGSGIAGRGTTWMVVRVHDGAPLSTAITTKAALRRAIREQLAGPLPDPQHPERYYATKHHNRYQSGHYIWKIKRWKEQR